MQLLILINDFDEEMQKVSNVTDNLVVFLQFLFSASVFGEGVHLPLELRFFEFESFLKPPSAKENMSYFM